MATCLGRGAGARFAGLAAGKRCTGHRVVDPSIIRLRGLMRVSFGMD